MVSISIEYIGIDPGKKGGIVVISNNKIIAKYVMPMVGKEYDIQALKQILTSYSNAFVAIENVHAIQGKNIGNSSNFSFGFGKGILQGLVEGLEIPYALVNAKAWQKVAWQGVTKQKTTKQTSLIAAKRLFPTESFLSSSRARNAHDGLVDAALIAYYASKTL